MKAKTAVRHGDIGPRLVGEVTNANAVRFFEKTQGSAF